MISHRPQADGDVDDVIRINEMHTLLSPSNRYEISFENAGTITYISRHDRVTHATSEHSEWTDVARRLYRKLERDGYCPVPALRRQLATV